MTDQPPVSTDPSGEFARRILLLFAHPALEKSRVNRRLLRELRTIPGITFHDLYEAYPDFVIRVDHEQELLSSHDIIVLQHPFFWYSTPAILKEWQDLVLEHGWAYGTDATALRGKWLTQVVTAGGREQSYRPGGLNRQTVREFLRPIEQTASLCQMSYLPPFIVHGTHSLKKEGFEPYAAGYRRLLEALRDDQLDLEAARTLTWLNEPGGPLECEDHREDERNQEKEGQNDA